MKMLATANDGQWTESPINKGFNIQNARKRRVVDGLQRLLQYDKIIFTEESTDAKREFEDYEIGPEGEETSKHQNCVDAVRYSDSYR